MIPFMWVITFVVALIPGGLVGWMTAVQWALLGASSVAAAFIASRIVFNSADQTTNYHLENLSTFLPPITYP